MSIDSLEPTTALSLAVRLASVSFALSAFEQIRVSRDAFGEAGAGFLVTPGVTPEVVRVAVELGIPALPGALSPTEIATAQRAGATAVKLFPASLGGPGYLRVLRGPFSDVPFVPTGGIELADVRSWLDAGATCVGLGSALVGATPPATPGDLRALTERARRVVRLAGRR